jgi:hypothetical protein
VENAIGAWMGTFIQGNHPALWYEERDDSLEFHDTRSCAESDLLKIDGLLRYVYLLTEDGISRNRLIGEMESRKFPGTGDDADGALAFLVNKKLVLEVDGQFLGLATKGPPPSHAALEDAPLGYIDPTYYHRELTTLINGTS